MLYCVYQRMVLPNFFRRDLLGESVRYRNGQQKDEITYLYDLCLLCCYELICKIGILQRKADCFHFIKKNKKIDICKFINQGLFF